RPLRCAREREVYALGRGSRWRTPRRTPHRIRQRVLLRPQRGSNEPRPLAPRLYRAQGPEPHQHEHDSLTRRKLMTTIIKGDDPRITIRGLANALAKIGLTLPESVTATPQTVTVPDPDTAEIVDAIQAADGDPAADTTVQRLITA